MRASPAHPPGTPPADLAGASGEEMVILEVCRGREGGCPNALLDTGPWRAALAEWLERDQVHLRLRRRLGRRPVLYHHKLRIALAGCPNGCSRPQIADLALVGTVRPALEPGDCLGCGECVESCPDRAITLEDELPRFQDQLCLGCLSCQQACPQECISLSPPAARLLVAGKLGRHPHLAREVARVERPEQAVELMAAEVERYLRHSRPGTRFAAWWLAQRG